MEMINLKYNFINLIKVILSALHMFLMLRLFGVSQGSDIYLLACSILASWHFIPYLFMGQFMQFYNDLKVESVEEAHKFYNHTLLFSFIIGIILFLICFNFLNLIVHCYTINLDSERMNILLIVLNLLAFSNIFIPLVLLTEQLFVAEKYFFQSYMLRLIILAGPVFTMLCMLFAQKPNIKFLAGSYALSVIISGLYGVFFVAKKIIPFKFVLKTKNFKKFVSNSLTMYFGHSIYALLLPVILNNFLVNFSNGIISCFYYSKNAMDATNMITTDYSNKELSSKLSSLIAKKDFEGIRYIIKKYLIVAPLFFICGALAVYFALPYLLKIIFYNSSFTIDINTLTQNFIVLIFWFVFSIFTNPYATIISLCKKSFIVIIGNTLFIILLALYLNLCSKNIFNIAVATFFVQLVALIFYFSIVKRMMKKDFYDRLSEEELR